MRAGMYSELSYCIRISSVRCDHIDGMLVTKMSHAGEWKSQSNYIHASWRQVALTNGDLPWMSKTLRARLGGWIWAWRVCGWMLDLRVNAGLVGECWTCGRMLDLQAQVVSRSCGADATSHLFCYNVQLVLILAVCSQHSYLVAGYWVHAQCRAAVQLLCLVVLS